MRPWLSPSIAVLLLCLLAPGARSQAPPAGNAGYPTLYRHLTSLAPDSSKVGAVHNLVLHRDVATFTLRSGNAYLCRPFGGRTMALVFIGDGTFSYVPPTNVERAQLHRLCDSTSMEVPFTQLFLVFADSTAEEFGRAVRFASGTPPQDWNDRLEESLDFICNDDTKQIDPEFADAFLNGDRNDLFYSEFSGVRDPLFFEINPYVGRFEAEEVRFMRKERVLHTAFREVVNQFQRSGVDDRERGRTWPRVRTDHYRIDFAIGPDLEVNATAEMTLHLTVAELRWLRFDLHRELRVDSVTWGNGTHAAFTQTGADNLWLRNEPAAFANGAATVRIAYHGKLFDRVVDWIRTRNPDEWYPRHDASEPATFDITYHYPGNMKLASVGKAMAASTNDGVTTARWVDERPTDGASFGIGLFSEQQIAPDSIAPITVYRGPTSSGGVSEQVAWDLEHSIKFFEFLFGKLPLEHFYATEIPDGHGQAFPGLIHLSESTFDHNDQSGFHELFRAHEVAHQWWGIGVGCTSYRDQWLGEGFAEYAGLMYMQAVLKDNDKFFKRLRTYREHLIDDRRNLIGKGDESGPIWLGQRNNSADHPGDYFVIIYEKGAWVLHMLRNLLLDLPTMKEDRYRGAMREFFTMYQGSTATTDDFRRVAERYAGMPLDWFFDEWVYGSAIPSYTWSSTSAPNGDGKYRLSLRVRTANVPDDFQMYVPVKIDFGDGKAARLRVLVKGPLCEPQLPLMPLEPKKIIFNDLESVLCESKQADWEE